MFTGHAHNEALSTSTNTRSASEPLHGNTMEVSKEINRAPSTAWYLEDSKSKSSGTVLQHSPHHSKAETMESGGW